jgi:hypothetical protein
VDPSNPQTFQFLPDSSRMTLGNGSQNARPGNTPAKWALYSPVLDMSFAVRDLNINPTSGVIPLVQNDSTHWSFSATPVSWLASGGRLEYSDDSQITGTEVLTPTRYRNQPGGSGVFTYFPDAEGSNMFLTLPLRIREFLLLGSYYVSADLGFYANFGQNNIAQVTAEDELVEVLGGPSQPGGASASFVGLSDPGTFSIQKITTDGLSLNAFQALSEIGHIEPDIYINPDIYELGFTGSFSSANVTIGLSGHVNPELRPRVYHFQAGDWTVVEDAVFDFNARTVKFTANSFSPFLITASVPEVSSGMMLTIASLGLGILVRARRRSA